jgi:protein-S-isoprenylcysteine O-methyltransferase Ste14
MPHHWPPLLIGLLMLAYWGSVIRMVWKTKKRVGKAGNFLPPELIGRVLRILWYPLVIVWIAHPMSIAFVRKLSRLAWPVRPMVAIHEFAAVPLALAVMAFIATLICWRKMGRSWRMGIDPNETTELIVQGPYAFVRHPIYTLSILLMLCTMVIVSTPLMLLVGVLHIVFLIWEATREERYLAHVHGEPYGRYAARTGRFIPRLSGTRRPAAGDGILPHSR